MKKVTLYTTDYCPFCTRAKVLLESKNIEFEQVNLSEDPQKRVQLQDQTGWMTVPMIFIGEEFIGGFDDLDALDQSGELDQKLSDS